VRVVGIVRRVIFWSAFLLYDDRERVLSSLFMREVVCTVPGVEICPFFSPFVGPPFAVATMMDSSVPLASVEYSLLPPLVSQFFNLDALWPGPFEAIRSPPPTVEFDRPGFWYVFSTRLVQQRTFSSA